MDSIIKEIFKMIKELREVSKANNELLGFICQKISPDDSVEKDCIDIGAFMTTSLEMSEMFEKYDIMPDEFGIS
jgi:hypothetical protein|tara:strand:+ start:1808 stop:2029 length:222 start_codon:yes stop_codon:yes gene_type:complete